MKNLTLLIRHSISKKTCVVDNTISGNNYKRKSILYSCIKINSKLSIFSELFYIINRVIASYQCNNDRHHIFYRWIDDNNSLLSMSIEHWYHVTSIDLCVLYKFNFNLIKQLQIKMRNLMLIGLSAFYSRYYDTTFEKKRIFVSLYFLICFRIFVLTI